MITCPCSEHPITPHFYNSKTRVYRGIHDFLIFALKHRLRRFLRVLTTYVLSKNKKNIKIFQLKIIIFTAVKNCCILHGRVFVMMNDHVQIKNCDFFLFLLLKHGMCMLVRANSFRRFERVPTVYV